jgi:hypothetical protein
MSARSIFRARVIGVLAGLALCFASAADARPGEIDESIAARAASRPPVKYLRAIDLLPGAHTTAHAWSGSATLVYVKNADTLAADGSARAWTFVYSSDDRGARAFTFAESGRLSSVALPFIFDSQPIESGWIEPSALLTGFVATDNAARAATLGARVAVLSRGLLPARLGSATQWYIGDVRGIGGVFDALRGTTLSAHGADLAGATGASAETPASLQGLPPFLVAYRAGFLAVLEARANDPRTRRDRPRELAAAETRGLARLAATQAAFDTLARATTTPAMRDFERALAELAAWRLEQARADSFLAASEARLAGAEKDLATERPTELALYLALERRARPASLRVFVDGIEIARRTYGTADWTSLDAGTWSEIARARVRPGARTVRVEIEDADRRVERVEWSGSLRDEALSLLRLTARPEGAGSRLEPIAETRP